MRLQEQDARQTFACPYCWERGSLLVDLTVEGKQCFVQDCEVCCNPIEFSVSVEDGKIRRFSAEPAQLSG